MIDIFVPADLAQGLAEAGVIEASAETEPSSGTYIDLGSAIECTLIVLGSSADMVALTGVRAPLDAIAGRIAQWRSSGEETDDGRAYNVVATGPGGKAVLELDNEPDPVALQHVLTQVFHEP